MQTHQYPFTMPDEEMPNENNGPDTADENREQDNVALPDNPEGPTGDMKPAGPDSHQFPDDPRFPRPYPPSNTTFHATPESVPGETRADNSDTILRLLALVEQIHRATYSRVPDKDPTQDIITRIERLETWVSTNRLP
jgi:hypothetical protein